MRGMNRLAMGTTLAVAFCLAMLLALLLFLLFNLFCSLLRDKRHQHNLPRFSNNETAAEQSEQPPRPLSFPFYAHGVLKAPREYLLSVPNLEAAAAKQASSPDRFVCISNPIYDGITAGGSDVNGDGGGTPFVTPKASPSCFEADEGNDSSPPLKLMKKLPAVLPKVLFDGRRSLGASTETNRPSSSSSSNSLCCSPSW